MRRWLFVLLLLIMPLQMVWAAASSSCSHETEPAKTQHFGHHAHAHMSGADAPQAADDDEAPGMVHPDCESCHLGCAVTIPRSDVVLAVMPSGIGLSDHRSLFESHVPFGPERPDRVGPNAAVRFGGDAGFTSFTA
jgi:hypothetical protein